VSAIFTKYCHISEKSFKMYLRKTLGYKSTFFSSIWQLKIMVLCEIVWEIKIEIASWISDGALISDSPFFHSFPITHDHLSISPLFSRPHLLIGAPDLRRERAAGQKTSCLSRRKAASYLSFSEQAAIGSMRRCSLDFFCILFCIKAKKNVGFGAKPQESMDNE
jgi:hypothetical protein